MTAEYVAYTRMLGATLGAAVAARFSSADEWLAGGSARAALLVAAGQSRAAGAAEPYLLDTVGDGPATLVPEAFAGVASDGRSLVGLMDQAAYAAPVKSTAAEVARAAQVWLQMAVPTQVADAARGALRSGMAVRDVGGVRVASPPCCGRCAVLHGRYYSWKANFRRHPHCDCTYQPVRRGERPAVDPINIDQVRGLSKADRWAVENGADLGRVVNAQRGMYTVEQYGQRWKATTDSTVHRDAVAHKFGTGLDKAGPRLRPESILDIAGDSDEAIDLLRAYGYVK